MNGQQCRLLEPSLRGRRAASSRTRALSFWCTASNDGGRGYSSITGQLHVRQLCRHYLQGHVEVNRKTKSAVELARVFKAMLGPIADKPATTITRAEAFDLLESYRSTPVLATRLRMELWGAFRVPLVGRAEVIVRRRLDQAKGTVLFPSSRGKTTNQTVVQHGVYYHQPYCKIAPNHDRPRLPVAHWSAHDLRRTTRTLLATIGCPNEIAEAVLVHVQPGIIGIYNWHTYDRERREWLTKLSHRLEEIAATYPLRK